MAKLEIDRLKLLVKLKEDVIQNFGKEMVNMREEINFTTPLAVGASLENYLEYFSKAPFAKRIYKITTNQQFS